MPDERNGIQIDTSAECDLVATGAWLHCSVRGSSLVTGNAALHKAREVAQLVADIQNVGVPESAIHLQNVVVENESGVITRSSSARYSLRIQCDDLENLANMIGVITSQKNATLHRIEWSYPPQETFYEELLGQCLPESRRQAELVAQGLNVQITSVRRFNQSLRSHEKDEPLLTGIASVKRAHQQATVTTEELGLQISHQKILTLRVTIEYSIAPYKNTGDKQ